MGIIDRKDLQSFEALVRDWFEFQHASLSSHKLSAARYMTAYKSYLYEQRLLSATSLGVKVLSRAFSKFTHLEELAAATYMITQELKN